MGISRAAYRNSSFDCGFESHLWSSIESVCINISSTTRILREPLGGSLTHDITPLTPTPQPPNLKTGWGLTLEVTPVSLFQRRASIEVDQNRTPRDIKLPAFHKLPHSRSKGGTPSSYPAKAPFISQISLKLATEKHFQIRLDCNAASFEYSALPRRRCPSGAKIPPSQQY